MRDQDSITMIHVRIVFVIMNIQCNHDYDIDAGQSGSLIPILPLESWDETSMDMTVELFHSHYRSQAVLHTSHVITL